MPSPIRSCNRARSRSNPNLRRCPAAAAAGFTIAPLFWLPLVPPLPLLVLFLLLSFLPGVGGGGSSV